MYTSHQPNRKTNNANLAALKTKLESLEQSFKKNLLSISDDEIENLINSNINNKITAWNWSKSFTQ
ncbi:MULTISPECIES: darobactin family peptide antibiotic [Yersinia]|uniref:darobactin family peptide antibiotic n=2 Tax=Yersinia TaxID=629 RepID=UPI0011A151A0|nr:MULTISPECIES: darobactin family peptide antibiotic [Yersinia]MDA5543691.1 darobactin family peptide antibiotic [Yersinia rochesterensis]MDN0106415.1 darobactin family peptide antibiotic [Yersinia rochesterensis]MDR5017862.1 darobactin family peptide antibiotic [Yersinia rochesterensis]UZM76401.1 darobactin family peptide antibiotic [Yersinia sp. SCPM-O-B-9106 (C-191)]